MYCSTGHRLQEEENSFHNLNTTGLHGADKHSSIYSRLTMTVEVSCLGHYENAWSNVWRITCSIRHCQSTWAKKIPNFVVNDRKNISWTEWPCNNFKIVTRRSLFLSQKSAELGHGWHFLWTKTTWHIRDKHKLVSNLPDLACLRKLWKVIWLILMKTVINWSLM